MKRIAIPKDWNGAEALAVANLLDRIMSAIWQSHGCEMMSELEEQHQSRLDQRRARARRRRRLESRPNAPDTSDSQFDFPF